MGAESIPPEEQPSLGVRFMLIGIDDSWGCAVSSVEGFAEKSFCCLSIPLSREEKI